MCQKLWRTNFSTPVPWSIMILLASILGGHAQNFVISLLALPDDLGWEWMAAGWHQAPLQVPPNLESTDSPTEKSHKAQEKFQSCPTCSMSCARIPAIHQCFHNSAKNVYSDSR